MRTVDMREPGELVHAQDRHRAGSGASGGGALDPRTLRGGGECRLTRSGERKKQSEPLLEMSIKLRRPCGFELALHCAFESGANQSPSRGDAVPNFRWENRMLA